MPIPNLFIIGVQKAGTTSLHNWLMQHKDIFSNSVLKDRDVFGELFEKGIWKDFLNERSEAYSQEKYFLQTHVNYTMYEKSLMNIKENTKNPKLIFITRNPVDRAISAYKYFKRRKQESRTLKEALIYKPRKLESIDIINTDNNNFTYLEHGFYEDQIDRIYSIFKKNQVLVLDFNDLKLNPEKTLKGIFDWLNLKNANHMDLTAKNTGGQIKSNFLNKIIFKSNGPKVYLMKFVKLFFSQKTIDVFKERIYQFNVSDKENKDEYNEEELQEVKKYLFNVYYESRNNKSS